MATVHDLTVDVTEILVWDNVVLGEIVVEHITANSQITIVERIELGPALGAELSATEDERVEHDQAENESLELVVLVLLSLLVVSVIELADGATKVSLEILRSLVRNLDGVLQDGLRDDFHVRETRRLGRDEASEVLMAVIIDGDFEGALEFSHPLSHEMDVLDHEPVTLLGSVLESIHGNRLLTLSHRNVGEGLVKGSLAILLADALDIRGGVHTREEHEEGWGLDRHLVVDNLHGERWLLNELDAEGLRHILGKSTGKTVRSKGSEEKDSVEEADILEALRELGGLSLFITIPFLPLKSFGLHCA
jgi:hypothetical protein